MFGKSRGKRRSADASKSVGYLLSAEAYDSLCISGYTPLSKNPEVVAAVNKVASLIGSMTIRLMENTDKGDTRIKNALSRQVDITPNRYMTRMTLMSWIIRTLMLEGNGNAVVWPRTERGYLGDLEPIVASRVGFQSAAKGFGYAVSIDGKAYDPDNLLHFVLNPDPGCPWKGLGYRVALRDVVDNLAQASKTKRGFLSSKWKPSLVVRVNSDAEELSEEEGRNKLAKQYMENSEVGAPWMLSADMFEVQQVKPLSLNDLAIIDSVKLDKTTVAAILGVPLWVVGAGKFDQDEWNAFVNTTILPIVRGLEQELTRKLLISENMFFRMNPWSLYSYDIKTLADVGGNFYVRGIMEGNEVRDWIGLDPKEGLDELVILENYIPLDKIGDQLKLAQGGEKGD